MIQGACFAAAPKAAPRSEAAAPRPETAASATATEQDAKAPVSGAGTGTTAASEPASRGAGATHRANRASQDGHAAGSERSGEDFAALLLPAGDAPVMPVATTNAPATTPAATAERTAATPDQWLAMLAGALAQPIAVNTPDATPVAPAGIPTSAQTLPTAPSPSLPPVLGAAAPTTTSSPPSLATSPVLDAALGALLPVAEPTADNGGDAKPAFDTLLGALAAPTAPVTVPTVREAAPPPPALQMPADPTGGFDDGIGTHIAWMAGQRLGEARIQVHPEHLGPIEVTLKLDDARVDAQFHSTHVEVRAALEASVPRLREMLAQHGLQLGQADVGQRHGTGSQPQSPPASSFGGGEGEPGAAQMPSTPIVQRRGLLDEYA